MADVSLRSKILVVDDNPSIHEDFNKILGRAAALDEAGAPTDELDDLEAELFGDDDSDSSSAHTSSIPPLAVELVHAQQGQEAFEIVKQSVAENRRFALAFVDMRMPPGWDGLETIEHLWSSDPDLEIVICSAYSDNTWEDMVSRLGSTDRLLILKKPFEIIEVQQLTTALCEKSRLRQAARQNVEQLEAAVSQRTQELESTLEQLRHETAVKARREAELRSAQKLDALGRIAGGVAHEINSPLQFIGDALSFGSESAVDLLKLIDAYEKLGDAARNHAELSTLVTEVDRVADELDISFVRGELPATFGRANDGVERVTGIVRAMLGLTSDTGSEKAPADLNQLVRDALAVTSADRSDLASVRIEPGELPNVPCHAGELSQTLVALLSNARDAIEERGGTEGTAGTITVRTHMDDGCAILQVIDDGCGIPLEHRERVFDPFFTTKDVGRGTGQALAVAYRAIERCGGQLSFQSEVGSGTTFEVRLPIAA